MSCHPSVSDEASQSLCKNCGLCCNGALGFWVPLEPTEVDKARNFGINVIESEHPGPRFAQPCPKFLGSRCSIYSEWRPQACSSYQCHILKRLKNGELKGHEAQAIVDKAKSLADAASGLLASSGNPTSNIWSRLEEFAKQDSLKLEDAEFSRRHPLLGMHMVVLAHLIDQEFRKEKPTSKDTDAASLRAAPVILRNTG